MAWRAYSWLTGYSGHSSSAVVLFLRALSYQARGTLGPALFLWLPKVPSRPLMGEFAGAHPTFSTRTAEGYFRYPSAAYSALSSDRLKSAF